MNDDESKLVFETVLDAPPEKVWRALTIPEYRDRWLQRPDNVDLQVVDASEGETLTYSWQERPSSADGHVEESLVTVELVPNGNGTTGFRLTHVPLFAPTAANSNESMPTLMRAA